MNSPVPSNGTARVSPPATDSTGSTARNIATLADDSWQAEIGLPGVEAAPPRFGRSIRIAMDPKARIISHAADPTVVEHYRRLRTKLIQQHNAKPFSSVVVTSASPQEGKSVTTMNVALSFAMLPGFRILVVDGDIRRGSLGKWLGITGAAGLSDLIEGSATLDQAVLNCDELSLSFMPCGNSKVPPAELLQSAQLGATIRELTEHFSLVLVDSPPVNLMADSQLLAAKCDAVLVVARAFSTTCKAFEKAVQDLQPFRVLGAVLNGGAKVHRYGRYKSYY